MSESTKLNPAPLDAFETAKPDEPIFTLQGGDPLAAPLVRLWAYLARVRAGLPGDVAWIAAPIHAAQLSSVADDQEKVDDLLLRATAAEYVSWHMDGYRRGDTRLAEEIKEYSDVNRLDIYDIRRRACTCISNFFGELEFFRQELAKPRVDLRGETHDGFIAGGDELDNALQGAILALRAINERIEIKRGNL